MNNINSSFLKEMGITEWTYRNPVSMENSPDSSISISVEPQATHTPRFKWWFIGEQVEGDAQLLLQNIVRVLGLGDEEWSWINSSKKLSAVMNSTNDIPTIAFAFGGSAAQKITGERDALPQLRETVLAINEDGLEEIPVIATFDLLHLVSRPKDKALLWQDLLMAKSVLQSL
jgi:DNA polymerase